MCYQHTPVNVASTANENAECIRLAAGKQLSSLGMIECPGLCALAEVLSISADGMFMYKHLTSSSPLLDLHV